jgi:hypothetical protein
MPATGIFHVAEVDRKIAALGRYLTLSVAW